MRYSCLLTLLVLSSNAFGQTGLASRQQAVDSINDAIDDRVAMGDFVSDTEDAIDQMAAGPVKDAVELAFTAFVGQWAGADTAAAGQIADANSDLAAGDAETNPMLQGVDYANAVAHAVQAQNTLASLSDDWDVFLAAIAGTGWNPPYPFP